MKTLCSSILLVVGMAVGLLSAGCQGETDESLEADEPELRPEGGGPLGTGGVNSLLPADFHLMKYALLNSFNYRAMDSALPGKVNPTVANLLGLGGPGAGERTMHYAASCALDAGLSLAFGAYTFDGDGFITHGGAWESDPIMKDSLIRDGVLTCVAARLNPYGQVVKILQLGPQVPYDGATDTSDYPFREMVISAVYDPKRDAKVIINVWPLEDMEKHCGLALEGSLGSRLCDNNPSLCGFVYRTDFNTACTGSPGDYTCDGVPAIETRLQAIDVSILHPQCNGR